MDDRVWKWLHENPKMLQLTDDLPKPMLEVRGKPILAHIIEGLRTAGVRAEGPNVLETIPITVEYRADPALPAGVERELSPGHIGYVVENFRIITYADGTTKRQRFAERYQMQPKKYPCPGGSTGATAPPPEPP